MSDSIFSRIRTKNTARLKQRTVHCTECDAAIGQPCKTSKGTKRLTNHRQRIDAYRRTGA